MTSPGEGYTIPTVDFDMPDGPDGVQAKAHALWITETGVITEIVVDDAGSGYSSPPNVIIRDGTIFKSISHTEPFTPATDSATLAISAIKLDTFGSGYVSAPTVTISDPTGTGASAKASVNAGAVTTINLTAGGSNYITQGGIKKFQDGLPMLCIPAQGQTFADCASNNLGQHLPVAVPDTTTFSKPNFDLDADYYVIGLVQAREQMNSSLPITGTLLREYVQLEPKGSVQPSWSKHVALQNKLVDGSTAQIYWPGTQDPVYAVGRPALPGAGDRGQQG